MDTSSRERFLGICRFERSGDLYLSAPYFNSFWRRTVSEWVNQGAPTKIVNSRFRDDYFRFEHTRILHEVVSGIAMDREVDLGNGIIYAYEVPPIVPVYKVEFLARDEHTITLLNEGHQKVRIYKNNPERMPTFLEYPVKDRHSWEEYKNCDLANHDNSHHPLHKGGDDLSPLFNK